MPNRAFFKNWDSILLFSVVGTLFNALAIGIAKVWLYIMHSSLCAYVSVKIRPLFKIN